MKKLLKSIAITVGVLGVVVLFAAIVQHFYRNKITEDTKKDLGIQCVKALYEFSSGVELDKNMEIVKTICTDVVYSDLTIDNEERTLTTYLKFENKPVKVNIVKSTGDYIYYTLDTETIDESRLFIFNFNVNEDGLIDWVKECECIEFLDTIN